MTNQESRLRLVAEFVDKATSGLRRMGGELVELAKKEEALRKTSKVAGIALLGAGVATGAFLLSATKLAARVETLGVVVDTLGDTAGYSAGQLDAYEKSIIKAGITTQAARQSMAQMLQVQLDLAHASDLARIAQDAAVIANVNSSDAFQKLVYTIQTGNILMGRTLGLQLDFVGAQEKLAGQLGKTRDQLSAQEITQARTNEVMRAGVGIAGAYSSAMETAGKKVLSLDRHIEESRRILGEAYLPIYASLVDTVTDLLVKFEKLPPVMQRQIAVGAGVGASLLTVNGAALLLVSMLPKLAAGLEMVGLAGKTILGPVGLLVGVVNLLVLAVTTARAANLAAIEGEEGIRAANLAAKKSYADYTKEMEKYREENDLVYQSIGETMRVTGGYTIQLDKSADALVLMSEAQYNAQLAAESSDIAMLNVAQTIALIRDRSEVLAEAKQREADAWMSQTRAAGMSADAYDGANTSLANTIETMRDNYAWIAGGGLELEAAAAAVHAAFLGGDITSEEARAMLQPIETAALSLQEEIGQISMSEAQRQYIDEYGGSWGEARDAIIEAKDNIDNIPAKTIAEIETIVNVWVKLLGSRGGIDTGLQDEGQHGLHGIVPPGYPDDSFKIGVSSGEEVSVKTKDQQRVGGSTMTNYITVRDDLDLQRLGLLFRRA